MAVQYCMIPNFTRTPPWILVAISDCTLGPVVLCNMHSLTLSAQHSDPYAHSENSRPAHGDTMTVLRHCLDPRRFTPSVRLISFFHSLLLPLEPTNILSSTPDNPLCLGIATYNSPDRSGKTAVTNSPFPNSYRCWVCPANHRSSLSLL